MESIEAVGVTITLEDGDLDIVSVYCPKGNDVEEEDVRALFEMTSNAAIIGGDFNGHSVFWEDGRAPNQCGNHLSNYLEEEDKFVLATPKNLKTRMHHDGTFSTIDLTFVTPELEPATTIDLGPSDWPSDHRPVIISMNVTPSEFNPIRQNWSFRDGEWDNWNSSIQENLQRNEFLSINSPARAFEVFQSSIIGASETYFSRRVNPNPKEKRPPWWTNECQEAVSEARRARRRWLENPLSPALKTEMNRLEAVKKKIVKKSYREHWEKRVESLEKTENSKEFFAFAREIINGRSTVSTPAITTPAGVAITDSRTKAQTFLDHYLPAPHNAPRSKRSRI